MRLSVVITGISLLSAILPVYAADSAIGIEDGVKVEWSEDVWLKLGGRVHYDSASFDDDVTKIEDNDDFRRARTSAKLKLRDWRLRADYDFGVSEGWKSAYIQYAGFEKMRITLGNHVAPFSMEDLTGSNDLPFLERSLMSALIPGLLKGLSLNTWGNNWTAAVGFFQDELSELDKRKLKGDSVIARGSFAPLRKKGAIVHIGVAYEYRQVDHDQLVRIRARPETRLTNTRLIDTRSLDGIDDASTVGLEFAAALGGARLQSEYSAMTLDANDASSTDLDGYYLLGSYLLTGEKFRYSRSRGTFSAVKPKRDWGAIELSLRLSNLDLNDGDVFGGEQEQATVGLSWYINQNMRITVNHSEYKAEPNRNGINEDGAITLLRFQASI